MYVYTYNKRRMSMAKLLLILIVLFPGFAAGQNKDSSLTIYPVLLGDRPMTQIAEVLALMLERGGMSKLEVQDAGGTLQTEFALKAEFAGTPSSGFTEIRGTLVDRDGKTVWSAQITAQDADFKKIQPREPMQCAYLLIERLRPVLNLDNSRRPDAPQGKFSRLMEERSGLPPADERTALKTRQETLKKIAPDIDITILGDNPAGLVAIINADKVSRARVAASEVKLDIKPAPNELRMLWDLARAFRDYVKKNPPETEYSLYAQYLGDLPNGKVGAVHFVVCNRVGDWVIVDMQNNNQEDFRAVAPKSAGDCDKLVAKRLSRYLR
jgi:hypothetical protein